MRVLTTLLCILLTAISLQANAPKTSHFYVIILNGQEVTIDGELTDWQDADFIYISQDGPNHQLYEGGQPTESPADFSANVAIKMDPAHIYFAAKVRDEGGALIHDPFTTKNAGVMWAKDHFAAYLGLFDIGNLPGSPHKNIVDIIDPNTGTVVQSGRTYRVKPGTDNDPDNATLGADYQLGVAIQTYTNTLANGAYYAKDQAVINYCWGYVDTLIAKTELAIKLWQDEKGYTLEWKIPFASLAGKIARPSKIQSVLEWPLYTPKDGDVIPFDIDLTDEDRVGESGSNFFRFGPNGSLWRDSFAFGGRGIVREASQIERSNYYFAQFSKTPATTIDGDLNDWVDLQFIGMSQDSPNRGFYEGGQPTSSPADFSAYFAMRMDQENLYLAARVRDEGGAIIHDPFTRNNAGAMWTRDHFATYWGLFDIGALPGSPHKNIVDIIDPSTGTVVQSGRTYRVKPGADNDPDQATLGADYQLGVAIQAYTTTLANGAYYATNEKVINYCWGYVDTLLAKTELAIKLWEGEKGYNVEWKIPLTSLAGKVARRTKPQFVLEWPLYTPEDGDVIPFDIDLTDEDRIGETGSNFLRFGPNGSLWRDSFAFGLRAKVLATDSSHVLSNVEEHPVNLVTRTFDLKQNYPNPFNPATTIEFNIPNDSRVVLKVFNLLGQLVTTLLDRELAAGQYRIHWDAANLPNGMYIYQIQYGNQVEAHKMLLTK